MLCKTVPSLSLPVEVTHALTTSDCTQQSYLQPVAPDVSLYTFNSSWKPNAVGSHSGVSLPEPTENYK